MSNKNSATAPLRELFLDATKEVIEKGRIKSQMLRLERIMDADKARKKSLYAEIGKLYVEGNITAHKGKVSLYLKSIKHIDERLERAEARYEMLKEAHSLDECTDAFRTEISNKINKAKDSVAITAYGVKKKTKDTAKDIGSKSSDAISGIKSAAGSAVRGIASGKKFSKRKTEEETETKDFTALLADLDVETPEEEQKENAELNAVLSDIDALLREVEEESAEDKESPSPAQDGESAESFDF